MKFDITILNSYLAGFLSCVLINEHNNNAPPEQMYVTAFIIALNIVAVVLWAPRRNG